LHQRRIRDGALDELRTVRQMVPEAAAQVVEPDDLTAFVDQAPADV
jgi:hypothetical protein